MKFKIDTKNWGIIEKEISTKYNSPSTVIEFIYKNGFYTNTNEDEIKKWIPPHEIKCILHKTS